MLEFKIELLNPLHTYFPGQNIEGRIIISLDKPKTMSSLKIELRGDGRVHWTESKTVTRDGKSETITIDRRSHESYLAMDTILFHGPELGIGFHVFPFNLFLPTNLPSSFEGKHGSIRFYLEGVVVRSWKWNHRVKKHFTLNSIVDLNMYQGCKQPGESRDSKTFCCLCCRSGPLCALIMTDRSGYVPGEYIIFTAEVDNQSSKEMTNTTVQLVEKVTFKAGGHTQSTSRIIAEQKRGRVGPGDSDVWNKVAMYVPGLPPSNLGGSCNIIQLQYILQLVVHPSGVGFALTVSLPITIGTIPLQEYMNQFSFNSGIDAPPPPAIYNSEFTQNLPGAGYTPGSDMNAPPPYPPGGYNPSAYPPGASAPPLPTSFSAYSNLPPPSYASSVWGEVNVKADDDDEHTGGDFQFVPQYPTYNVIKPY